MKSIILFASITMAAGLMFVNFYNSVVDAKSWGSDIPNSIAAAREYFKTVNPGNFFRLYSPINQVLALSVLILFWKTAPGARIYLGAALGMYVLSEMFTFAYFFPRNDIMWKTAQLTDVDTLRKAWSEWSTMNWLRTFMLLVGLCLSFLSLHKIYLLR
ncbi:MAG: DUF1772 domain-containing protein [Saprospiraceae bacterium]|nr:DUF1772 domain-containing protein [Saprospiraceae bacterium]